MTASATLLEPFLAGSYDPSPGSSEARSAELSEALTQASLPAAVVTAGPFTVATNGAGDPRALPPELPVCLLDGRINNLEAIAEAAGLPPSTDMPEVTLARAYLRIGAELVERMRGDFALVLWEREARRGLIARDQLDGRGIVWHSAGSRLLFASEVRHILALLRRVPEPDRAAIGHWLACSGLPDDLTLYAGVRRLPAGHLLWLEDSRWEVRRYWTPRYRRPLRAPREELVDRVRSALSGAVARRCDNGREVGVLLSGGIDSASIAAVAGRLPAERRPRRAYSATFPAHPSVDESESIGTLTRATAMASVRALVRSGGGIRSSLPYLAYWRLPALTPNLSFWQPLLGRAAAEGTRSVLTGEGGDELFGNAPPLMADHLRRGRLLAARAVLYRISSREGAPSREDVRRMAPSVIREFGLAAAVPPSLHRTARRLRGWRHYAPDWLDDATAQAFIESYDPTAWKRTSGPRWWAYRLNRISSGLGAGLVYDHARRRSAQLGVEAQHPFRDVDLVELLMHLPADVFFDRRWSRPLLREAMAGLLPDEIRLRPGKSTFDQVARESLAGPELRVVRALLSSPDAEVGAYIDLPRVRAALLDAEPPSTPRALVGWASQIWRLVTAECWLRTLADPEFPGRLAEEIELPRADVELVEVPSPG